MKVSPISNNRIITPKTTGYAAASGIILTAISGYSKNKNIRHAHKPLAYLTAVLTAVHIAIIEYNHHKWKKLSEISNS